MSRTYTLKNACLVDADGARVAPLPIARGWIASAGRERAPARDLPGHWILPGLINAHDHLHLNAFPRLSADAPFPNSYAWIRACQPRLREPDFARARAVPADARHWQGALKNLLCGAT